MTQPGRLIQGADDIGAFGTSTSNSSEARDVNRLGYAVGTAQLDNGWTHAFLKKPNSGMGTGFIDLAGSAVIADSTAFAVNSYQQVVGSYGYAFVHLSGWTQFQNLASLIPPGSNWQLLITANDINDRGEITGWGYYNDLYRAFLLTPIP